MQAADGDRLRRLEQMLERNPGDPFLLYGIGLEYKKQNEPQRAIEYLDRAIAADAGYCYAYFQKGMICESQGQIEAAKRAYRAGIDAAQRKGDAHALSELQGALEMID